MLGAREWAQHVRNHQAHEADVAANGNRARWALDSKPRSCSSSMIAIALRAAAKIFSLSATLVPPNF